MPRIAYFSNQFASSQGHGIARYSRHLFDAMQSIAGETRIIPVAAWSDLPQSEKEKLSMKTGLKILPWGRRTTPLAWGILGYPWMEKGLKDPVDLIHAVSLGYRIATKKPFVVTVHDIGPLTHPQFFNDKPSWIMRKALEHSVRHAARVICVSNATADALHAYVKKNYNTDLYPRVKVVHEGVSQLFFTRPMLNEAETKKWSFKTPYFLAVGKISPRKNLTRILEAMAIIKGDLPHHLIAVGGDGWDYKSLKSQIQQLGLTNRVHLPGYVSDHVLRHLYCNATAFVYPSLFEGFGLTILEAMASGCPVITSNTSSLPEVAGDAGVLIDPTQSKEIADAMMTLYENEEVHQEFRKKGIQHARSFTWENCAQGVLQVYKEVLA